MASAKKTTRASATKPTATKTTKSSAKAKTTRKRKTQAEIIKELKAELAAVKAAQEPPKSLPEEAEAPAEVPRELTAEEAIANKIPLALRNRTNTPFSFRLSRQAETKRKTELKPRGRRGDWCPLQPEDLEDEELYSQIQTGAVELITLAEAKRIASKQTTNQQTQHPAMALLRNPKGEVYEQGAVRMEPSFEDQGVVVARLDPGEGGTGEIVIGRGGIDRQMDRVPGAPPNGSNLVTQATSDGQVSAPKGRENEFAADVQARKKNLEGPAAGLGGLKVTLAPTERA